MSADLKPILRVGDLIVDSGTRQLTRNGQMVPLPKLSFELLLALIEAAPNLLTQDDLIQRVWPGRIVSPETVTQRIKLLRDALGDDAQNPSYVGLVRGQGYRLLANVERYSEDRIAGTENPTRSDGLFQELSRRRVLQVALLYAAVAWSITEVASFLIEALPVFPNWSKSLVAILFVVGFPVAMFLAWQFDIEPAGVRRTAARSTQGRVTILAALTLMIGATGGLFYLIYPSVLQQDEDRQTGGFGSSLPAANTIAVLPFENITSNSDDDYISEGLSEELRYQLAQFTDLRVAARTSSIAFREQSLDAKTIAERLGVAVIVEGTLQRQANSLSISVKLIDGASGFEIWSTTKKRTSRDLFAVQQDVAKDVVSQLLPDSLALIEKNLQPPSNISAHEHMQLARYYEQKVRAESSVNYELLAEAIDHYRSATIADPNSTLAYSRLGGALLYLGDIDAAQAPIQRALILDPTLSEVQATAGTFYWLRGLPGSGAAWKLATELNANNADALAAYAWYLWHQGDNAAPEALYRRALELDQMSLPRHIDLTNFLGMSGRREETLLLIERIRDRFQGVPSYLAISRAYELIGDVDIAIAWALKARDVRPEDEEIQWRLIELYSVLGDFATSQVISDQLDLPTLYRMRRYPELIDLGETLVIEYPNESSVKYFLAFAYLATGLVEEAVRILEIAGLPDIVLQESRQAPGVEALVTFLIAVDQRGDKEKASELARFIVRFMDTHIETGNVDWWPHVYRACALSILNEDEEALRSLDRAQLSHRLPWLPFLKDAPCFRDYADSDEYLSLLAKIEARRTSLNARLPATLAEHAVSISP